MSSFVKLVLAVVLFACAVFAHAQGSKKENLAKIKTQLAIAYVQNGNLKIALDSANEALDNQPRYMQAYLIRAYIYQLVKENTKAENDFRRALSIEPNNPEANSNFGWFLCQQNRVDESIAYFKHALSDPFYATPETAHLNLGVCLAKLKRFDDANAELFAALNANSLFFPAFKELSRIQYEQGHISAAVKYFERFSTAYKGKISADDLLFAANLYHASGDKQTESKYSNELRKKYPYSIQTSQLK